MTEPSFLVVRLGSLGDIVHTFPAVAALRETFPQSEIVWLTHPRWKLLVASSGLASNIWTTETRSIASLKNTIREIREYKFEIAVDYQGLWKSASLPFLGGVTQRIGFSSESIREAGVPLLYTDSVHAISKHIVDQNGELSRRAGANRAVAAVNLHLPPEESPALKLLRSQDVNRYVVLSPGGGWRSKCWPAERFGMLCKEITSSVGLRCVVNYGPGEDDLAAQVRAASGNADPVLFNDELAALMTLLRNAVCVVGGDTGPLHLAVAVGTPVVALFGPTDPARNGPYRVPVQSLSATPNSSASPHDIVLRAANVVTTHKRSQQTHPSMLEIQMDAVFDAVRQIVKERA